MNFIKNIFWNSEEGRIRALWRMAVQGIVFLVLYLGMQVVTGILTFAMMLSQPGALSDPDSIGRFTNPQAVEQFMMNSPLVYTVSGLTTLVAMFVSVWLAGRFLDRRRLADFGLRLDRDWWIDFAFGLALGGGLMLAIFLIELALGWVTVQGTFVTRKPETPFFLGIVPPLVFFLTVGFYEELFSRGYQLMNMAEGLRGILGSRGAILLAALISSLIFGVLHAANPNADWISTIGIIAAGLVLLGAGMLLTGELAIPIGVHITWNFFQGNVFGFPVSGIGFSWATFIQIEQGGPELWTGGAFGPEAGLIGLIGMVFGGLLTILWVRWRYGEAGLHLGLAQPPARVEVEEGSSAEG